MAIQSDFGSWIILPFEAEYIAPEHGRRHIIRPIGLFLLPDKAIHGLWSDEKLTFSLPYAGRLGKFYPA
ncbi:hypothetical protein N7524_001003 [Penicillium chrysogenum]|nr:hypothetical protein N7524_001003 [Penicillium chrysogenum]